LAIPGFENLFALLLVTIITQESTESQILVSPNDHIDVIVVIVAWFFGKGGCLGEFSGGLFQEAMVV
jgi:hypothetical protein